MLAAALHLLLAAALRGRLHLAREVVRGVDQADVRERLREVSDHALRVHVVLFGQAGRRRWPCR